MASQVLRENPCHHVIVIPLLLVLCSSAFRTDAAAIAAAKMLKGLVSGGGGSGGGVESIISDNINKATEKSEELIDNHMSAVDSDPGALITKETMQDRMEGDSFLPHKSTRSVMVEPQQGYNGASNFQPAGWKITETMSDEAKEEADVSDEKQPVATYPEGLGPVLLNGCTATSYDKSSPCYNKILFNLENAVCAKMMDAANYMGIGFDGRGYYRLESRKASLIQRSCEKGTTFNGEDVPDTMNVLGIFDTSAETKPFQSVDEYMTFIRNKAGMSDQEKLFTSEASKFSEAKAYGANMGALATLGGAAIGALFGGPVGGEMGAKFGGDIGGTVFVGGGSGSGKEDSTDTGERSSKVESTDKAAMGQGSNYNFFAIMYVNVILYEITLDEVKTTDINFAALTDYMTLPTSYFSAGVNTKYQNFLLRWGTHFIRSAKFGGQLKITKTAKQNKFNSKQDFASFAETEFQSMFATLQSSYSQKSFSAGYFGLGYKSKKASQSGSAASKASSTAKMNADNKQSQNFRQSEFTQTSVEAQGGMSQIAEALVDFYTPAFKQLFHDWLVSIKDYPKPFDFQLKPINELFNINMDDLFPPGDQSYGCVDDGSIKYNILVDPSTKMRYYIDTHTSINNGTTVEREVRVNCKYNSINDFKLDLQKRMLSLEKAIAMYMAEGPIQASSFDLHGGQPGCEEATIAAVTFSKSNSTPLTYAELLKMPFLIEFDLPQAVPDIITMQAKYKMVHKFKRWFVVKPDEELMHLYDGCQVANVKPTDKKLCFRNIIFTYEESTGLFDIEIDDFAKSKQRIPTLPQWLAGTTVARSRRMRIGSNSEVPNKNSMRPAIPCNVKWTNSHRLDPSRDENCIHFTAAGESDLFVIFAAVPSDHTTWYYLHITTDFVSFYHAMSLEKNDRRKGIGMLGHKNLYQSFFVCVIQKSEGLSIQYGKADSDSEIGTVHSSYSFPSVSQFSKVSFYSFGAGVKPVSLMDVRLTSQLPEVICLDDDYENKEGHCDMVCHEECNGCRQPRDNRACHECKNVMFQMGNGEDKGTTCVSQCPPGKYLSESMDKLCVPCSAGSFKATEGNQECSQCPDGTNSQDGASACDKCPAGTLSVPDSQKCDRCPSGTFAAKGASDCSMCPAGEFSDAGQAECSECKHGYFNNRTGAPSCEPCPAGTFANETGMISCTECLAGHYSTAGQVKCSMCSQGFFSSTAGSSSCEPCPAGSFGDKTGMTSCTQCPAGQHSTAGQVECSMCSQGSFSSTAGSSGCEPCPAGSIGDKTGMTSCTQCPAGHSSIAGQNKCEPCPNGYAAGTTVCARCPANSYSRSGDPQCKMCPSNGLGMDGNPCYPTLLKLGRCWGEAQSSEYSCENVIKASEQDNSDSKHFKSKHDGSKNAEVVFLLSKPSTLRRVLYTSLHDLTTNQISEINLSVEGYRGQSEGAKFSLQCSKVTDNNFNTEGVALDCDSGEDGYVERLKFSSPLGSDITLFKVKAYTD